MSNSFEVSTGTPLVQVTVVTQSGGAPEDQLQKFQRQLDRMEQAMARTFQDLQTYNAAVNDFSNLAAESLEKIAATEQAQVSELKKLRDQVATGGGVVTQEQLDAVLDGSEEKLAKLNEMSGKLRQLAADPNAPIPDGGEGTRV